MVALVTHMCNFARLFNFNFVFAVTLPCDVLFHKGRESAGGSVSLVSLHFSCAFRVNLHLHMSVRTVGGRLSGF